MIFSFHLLHHYCWIRTHGTVPSETELVGWQLAVLNMEVVSFNFLRGHVSRKHQQERRCHVGGHGMRLEAAHVPIGKLGHAENLLERHG